MQRTDRLRPTCCWTLCFCIMTLLRMLWRRLKHRTFSSNELRDYDFSERKDDGLKLHRTLEVLFVQLGIRV